MKNFKSYLFKVFIIIISFILITSFYENIVVTVKTNKFLDNQILDEERSDEKNKFYYKTNKDYYEKGDYANPGNFCDILLTLDSSIETPFIHDVLNFTVGGHAAIVGISYRDKYIKITNNSTIESTYNSMYKNAYTNFTFRWDDSVSFPNYYILRVDLTEEQSFIIFNEAVSMLEDPYNITFLLNVGSSSYCSDLVSKSFRKAGININYDFGATTVIDILASSKTKLIGMKYTKNGVDYYYTY